MLGLEPYFRRPEAGPPAYVEFRLGRDEDELGIMDRRYARDASGTGTSITYWNVDDVAAALAQLIAKGAREHEPLVFRDAGFVTASVVDPFGNVLGLMHSPHWSA